MTDRIRVGAAGTGTFLLLLVMLVACDSDDSPERDATPTTATETTGQGGSPSTTAASVDDPTRRFVGLEYGQSEGPSGVKHYGGGLLGSDEPYLYDHVEHEGRHMLWLERILRRGVAGRPGRLLVRDVYDLGRLPEGYWLQTVGCWPDDGRRPGFDEQAPTEPDLAVVVRYTPATARFSTDISQAVRLNWA